MLTIESFIQRASQMNAEINMTKRTQLAPLINILYSSINEKTNIPHFSHLQLPFEGIKKRTSICSSACAKREIYATHTQRHSHDHDPAARQSNRETDRQTELQT